MASVASAAASAAAASPVTLSSVVRRILVDGGNKPMRLNTLWDAVRTHTLAASAASSKTHFKRRIIGQMFVRDEVRVVLPCCLQLMRARPLSLLPSHSALPSHSLPSQLVKLRVVAEDTKPSAASASSQTAASSLVYAVRLKGSAKVHSLLQRDGLGVDVRAGARRLPAAGAPAAAAPPPAPTAPLQ